MQGVRAGNCAKKTLPMPRSFSLSLSRFLRSLSWVMSSVYSTHHCLLHPVHAQLPSFCRVAAHNNDAAEFNKTAHPQPSLVVGMHACNRFHLCRIDAKVKILYAYWCEDRNSVWNFGHLRIHTDGSNGTGEWQGNRICAGRAPSSMSHTHTCLTHITSV